jgi:hypothetical protein
MDFNRGLGGAFNHLWYHLKTLENLMVANEHNSIVLSSNNALICGFRDFMTFIIQILLSLHTHLPNKFQTYVIHLKI